MLDFARLDRDYDAAQKSVRYSPIPHAHRSADTMYAEPWLAFNGHQHKRFRTKTEADQWLATKND